MREASFVVATSTTFLGWGQTCHWKMGKSVACAPVGWWWKRVPKVNLVDVDLERHLFILHHTSRATPSPRMESHSWQYGVLSANGSPIDSCGWDNGF